MFSQSDHSSDIILSAYNSLHSIQRCLLSIIPHLSTDRRLLVVDDGSSDGTALLIQNLLSSVNKNFFHFICHQTNLGLTHSLNEMLLISTASLIFRIDADDYIHPDRFMVQEAYMNSNPAVSVYGSQAIYLRSGRVTSLPLDHESILTTSYKNPLIHSSVCFRRVDILRIGSYDLSFLSGQDHNLWYRCLINGYRISNCSRALVYLGPTSPFKYRPSRLFHEFFGSLIHEYLIRSNGFFGPFYLTLRILFVLPVSFIWLILCRFKFFFDLVYCRFLAFLKVFAGGLCRIFF